jgi:dynein heavy chain, axonemal
LLERIVKYCKYYYFREEKVKTIVDDIMEKMPEQFNMAEIMAKVEERTPYVIVCFQV